LDAFYSSDRAHIRFARPNIQIYDAHGVDLYQWVCARYFVGVKVQRQRQSAVKLGSRPNFRTDFPSPVARKKSDHPKIFLIYQ